MLTIAKCLYSVLIIKENRVCTREIKTERYGGLRSLNVISFP